MCHSSSQTSFWDHHFAVQRRSAFCNELPTHGRTAESLGLIIVIIRVSTQKKMCGMKNTGEEAHAKMASVCMMKPTTDSSVPITSLVSMRVFAMCRRCLQHMHDDARSHGHACYRCFIPTHVCSQSVRVSVDCLKQQHFW